MLGHSVCRSLYTLKASVQKKVCALASLRNGGECFFAPGKDEKTLRRNHGRGSGGESINALQVAAASAAYGGCADCGIRAAGVK